jgi:tetratricopeptide (TPR) repeat protein
MTASLVKLLSCVGAAVMLVSLLLSSPVRSQNAVASGTIEGRVCDAENRGLPGADVALEDDSKQVHLTVTTDSQGGYRFTALAQGNYVLRAKLHGWREASKGPLTLAQSQRLTVLLRLERDKASTDSSKNAAQSVQFSDEPTFTVAGVTDPTNLGGHGSDVALRTKESLAKATASLNNSNIEEDKRRVAVLRTGADSAELHALLGDIAESEGRPLDAVREYQRAAEMDPSEANLLAWGAELLLHRAFEPASEVFTKGHVRYPRSSRILVGLSVTSYARGMADEAAQQLAAACDIDPDDAAPYVFLGKLQSAEKTEPAGWTERLTRFAQLHPENALAHYYYAVALTKSGDATEHSDAIESSLLKAVELDPHLGDAYLQLGILYAQRKDFAKAKAAYEKAIANTPLPDEAHFRLAEAYRLTGDRAKAHDEIALYEKISKQKTQANEQERHKIQQFVYTLRGPANSTAPPQSPVAKPQ